MATRKLVPRADNEGGVGTEAKSWTDGWFAQMAAVKAQTITYASSLTWDLAAAQSGVVTLTGDITLNAISNGKNNLPAVIQIIQDSTDRTLSFTSAVFDLHGEVPVMPSGSGKKLWLFFICDGAKMHLTSWIAEE